MNKRSFRTLPQALCSLGFMLALGSAPEASQGFFLNDWVAKTIASPDYVAAPIPTDAVTATVNVDAGTTITKVSKYLFGNNAGAWDGAIVSKDAFMTDVANLSPNLIRWPGGSLSDEYFWDATSTTTVPADLPATFTASDLDVGSNKSNWTMPTDAYYDMLAKTKAQGCITVNYGYARYGISADPVATAAHYAAQWVRYDNGRTLFWEVGNENFGTWEKGFAINPATNHDGQPDTITGALYGKHASIFIDSMRAAATALNHTIRIGVVTMGTEPSWDVTQKNWNKLMMPYVVNKADFLSVHNYYGVYQQNSAVAAILNSVSETKTIMTYLMNSLKTYANHDSLPVALTEWNINATGSGQGVSFINGMHAALQLGELMQHKYGESSRWDFLNGWNNGDNMGLFADGETDIAQYTPRAPFFYMYYFQKYFGDQMVSSSVTGNSSVVSYASTFSSGQSGIVLVNKSATAQVIDLKLANFNVGSYYYYYTLTGGTDNGDFSRSVYVNGQSNTASGLGPTDYATLKPYGTNIVGGSIKLSMPKYSVTYVLVESSSTAGIIKQTQTTKVLQALSRFDLLGRIQKNKMNAEAE